jgi:DNA-binding CsgD family transcriptional regulator
MPAFPGTLFHLGEGTTDGGTSVPVAAHTPPRGGYLVVAPRGRILFVGHQVVGLLKRFFPPRPESRRLPRPLARWIASRDPNPLVWECGGRRLIVTLCDRSVKGARCYHVREAGPELSSFSPREIKILYWLVTGKTNEVIGLNLGLATNTIKKYLEPIYQKLCVENRVAAALSVREFFPEEDMAPASPIE